MSNIDFGPEYRLVFNQSSIVLLNLGVFRMLDGVIRDSFQAPSVPGSEIGGLLIGSDASDIRLEAIYPVVIEHRFGPSHQFTHEDIEIFRQNISRAPQQPGLTIIGHFRSLTQGKFEAVAADRIVTDLIGAPQPLMLLIQGSAAEPSLARLFRRSGGDYVELLAFSFAPATSENPTITKVLEPLKPVEPAAVRLTSSARRTRVKGVSIAALLACGALIAYFIPDLPKPPDWAARKDIGLTVRRTGGTLAVSWNRSSPTVRNGTSGVLTIVDGTSLHKIPLTPSQLRSSDAIAYTPQSIAVDFQLDVYHNRDRSSDENLVVVGLLPPNPEPVVEQETAGRVPTDKERQRTKIQRHFTAAAGPPPRQMATLDKSKLQAPPKPTPSTPSPETRPTFPPMPAAAPLLAEPLAIVVPYRADPPPILGPPQLDVAPQPISYVAPIPVRKVSPAVPLSLRSLVRHDISIEVSVSIDAEGKVMSAELVKTRGSGQKLLSPSAVQAAMLWRFEPARRNGQPVDSQTVLKFDFERREH